MHRRTAAEYTADIARQRHELHEKEEMYVALRKQVAKLEDHLMQLSVLEARVEVLSQRTKVFCHCEAHEGDRERRLVTLEELATESESLIQQSQLLRRSAEDGNIREEDAQVARGDGCSVTLEEGIEQGARFELPVQFV